MAERLGKTQKETAAMLDATAKCIISSLTEENQVVMHGFGAFEVRKKQERVLVNPSTKQQMIVPPKLTLAFKAGGAYKNKVKSAKIENSESNE